MKINALESSNIHSNIVRVYIFPCNSPTQSLLDVVLNLLSHLFRQIARGRVLFQAKLGPDNQVNDICVNSIRPVIVQDFGVIFPSYQYCNTTTGLTPAEKKIKKTAI